ncbi:hypothetical protein ABK040_013163 [Willaertia magna]
MSKQAFSLNEINNENNNYEQEQQLAFKQVDSQKDGNIATATTQNNNNINNNNKIENTNVTNNKTNANEEEEEENEEENLINNNFPVLSKNQVEQLNNLQKQLLFENCIKNMLTLIGEDINREGLLQTPTRVFKSYNKLCAGMKVNDPKEVLNEALFSSDNSQMVVVRDIEIYSLCEHHLLPVIGRAHVAYIPNGKVVGLSKIPRMVEMYARRLQIQERLTEQIAQAIIDTIQPEGVGVVIEARHMCMEMRGVEKSSPTTITSSLKGQFLKKETRKEFFDIINRTPNRL